MHRVSDQTVQTELGEFRLCAYQDHVNGDVHIALARGHIDATQVPLVRVHVADTLRDLLGVRGDTRAWTLRAALERISRSGCGVVVVLREQETSSELISALHTMSAPVEPLSTTSQYAERAPTMSDERGGILRTYGIGAQILKDLGVRRMRVLSAPKQMHGISAFDLEIEAYVSEES